MAGPCHHKTVAHHHHRRRTGLPRKTGCVALQCIRWHLGTHQQLAMNTCCLHAHQ
jgi:hypothetical protein